MVPRKLLLPDRDTMLITPPVKRPNSALLLLVCTRNSSTASGLGVSATMLPYDMSCRGTPSYNDALWLATPPPIW